LARGGPLIWICQRPFSLASLLAFACEHVGNDGVCVTMPWAGARRQSSASSLGWCDFCGWWMRNL